MLPSFRAVIFDMDGLVLDTEPTFQLAWQRAADELGVTLDDAFCRSLSGRQYADIEHAIAKRFGLGFPLRTFRDRSTELWRHHVNAFGIETKPGFDQLVDLLLHRHIPFCLATNSNRSNTLECLRLAGIQDCFTHIVSRDQVPRGKPAPDPFLEAARRLNVSPEDCLALEDSAIGIRSAWQAGTIPLMITDRAVVAEETADRACLVLSSLMDVIELLNKAGRCQF